MSVNVFPDDILSVCPIVSARSISPEPLNHFFYTKLGIVVYYHESMCHVEKLVHYLQCQGYSEGVYNQDMTISYNIY